MNKKLNLENVLLLGVIQKYLCVDSYPRRERAKNAQKPCASTVAYNWKMNMSSNHFVAEEKKTVFGWNRVQKIVEYLSVDVKITLQ